MANMVYVSGRLTATPEIKMSKNGKPFANITIAANKAYKTEGGASADFITCIAFGNRAKVFEKMQKGQFVGVSGSLSNNNYVNKDGVKVYSYVVTIANIDFIPQGNVSDTIDFSEHKKNGFSVKNDSDTGDVASGDFSFDDFPPFE